MTDIELGRVVYERFSQESDERAKAGTFITPQRAVERLVEIIAETAPDITGDRVSAVVAAFMTETRLRRKPKSQRLPS
jgi:hypothetical protein